MHKQVACTSAVAKASQQLLPTYDNIQLNWFNFF